MKVFLENYAHNLFRELWVTSISINVGVLYIYIHFLKIQL